MSSVRVVHDANILVSALMSKGKPTGSTLPRLASGRGSPRHPCGAWSSGGERPASNAPGRARNFPRTRRSPERPDGAPLRCGRRTHSMMLGNRERTSAMPNGGDTKSRVCAALSHAFPGAKVRVLERDGRVEVQVTSPALTNVRSEEPYHRILDALREDGGDHLHGARIEHLHADLFLIDPLPFALAESEVLTIRMVAPAGPSTVSRDAHPRSRRAPPSYDPNNEFAKILRGEADVPIILDDAHCLVCLAPEPEVPGHVFVITKKPTKDLFGLKDAELVRLFATARCVGRAVRDALGASGLMLIQRNGRIGGSEVAHCHVEVIPRFPNEATIPEMPVVGTKAVARQHAEAIRAALLGDAPPMTGLRRLVRLAHGMIARWSGQGVG